MRIEIEYKSRIFNMMIAFGHEMWYFRYRRKA